MKYATPSVELIQFDQQDVMVLSDDDYEGEKGELPPTNPWVTKDLTIRDIEDI